MYVLATDGFMHKLQCRLNRVMNVVNFAKKCGQMCQLGGCQDALQARIGDKLLAYELAAQALKPQCNDANGQLW